MDNQEVLDTMKTENTKTSDVVVITFHYDSDFTYESVVGFAQQFPTYQTKDAGKEQKHGVVFKLINHEIATLALKMWQLVEDWDRSGLKINNEKSTKDILIASRDELSKNMLPTQTVAQTSQDVTVEEPNWAVDSPGVVVGSLIPVEQMDAPVIVPSVQQDTIQPDLPQVELPQDSSPQADLLQADLLQADLLQGGDPQANQSQNNIIENTTQVATEQSITATEQYQQSDAVDVPSVVTAPVVPEVNIPAATIPQAAMVSPEISEAIVEDVEDMVNDSPRTPADIIQPDSVPPMPIAMDSVNNLASTTDTSTVAIEGLAAPINNIDLTEPSAFIPAPITTPVIEQEFRPINSAEFSRPLAEPIAEFTPELAADSIVETTMDSQIMASQLQEINNPVIPQEVSMQQAYLQPDVVQQNSIEQNSTEQKITEQNLQQDASQSNPLMNMLRQSQANQGNQENINMDFSGNPQTPAQVSEATVANDPTMHSPLHAPEQVATESIGGTTAAMTVGAMTGGAMTVGAMTGATVGVGLNSVMNQMTDASTTTLPTSIQPIQALQEQVQSAIPVEQNVQTSVLQEPVAPEQSLDGINANAFAAAIPTKTQQTIQPQVTHSQTGQLMQPQVAEAFGAIQTTETASPQEMLNTITSEMNLDGSDFSVFEAEKGNRISEQHALTETPQVAGTDMNAIPSKEDIAESAESFNFSEISIGRFPASVKESLFDASFKDQASNADAVQIDAQHREIDIGIGELPNSTQASIQTVTEHSTADSFEEEADDGSDDLGLKTVIDERDAQPIWRKLLGGGKN